MVRFEIGQHRGLRRLANTLVLSLLSRASFIAISLNRLIVSMDLAFTLLLTSLANACRQTYSNSLFY